MSTGGAKFDHEKSCSVVSLEGENSVEEKIGPSSPPIWNGTLVNSMVPPETKLTVALRT